VLAAPLVIQGRMDGVLTVVDRTGRFFSADDMRLMADVADRVALALENARLYDDTRARLARTRRLAQLSHLVGASLDFSQVADFVAEAAVDLLHADLARIWVVDETAGVARLAALKAPPGESYPMVATDLPLGQGIVGWVISGRTKRASIDLAADPLHLPHEWTRRDRGVSQLAVPLLVGERAVGVLVVITRTPRRFSQEDEELLEIFAAQAATALENAKLYQQAREAYEQLSLAQEQLAQSQKMEAVGRLAGGIAHDFNNLLTIISGRGELMAGLLADADPLRRHVDIVLKTAGRAAELTKQLLAFGRRQVLQAQVIDLNAVVAGLGTMLHRLLGEDITLSVSLAPNLGRIKADPGQIEQVVLNLAVNARDAMPGGGRLTLQTAEVHLDTAALRGKRGRHPGTYAVLTVSDTGVGMGPDVLTRVFEPFFTTKERGKATGLGLATVYGIVEQSEGVITVESKVGVGSTFRVHLPVVAEGEPPAPVAVPSAPRGGTETILLVEDEVEVRQLGREILEQGGYTVLEAGGGLEALAIAAAHPAAIQLLLSDVVMPSMNGREVAEVIGRLRPGIAVLYMSGYTDDALGAGVLPPGTDLLAKPFTRPALLRRVREILDAPTS
jgi:signal transduction histidine kinase